MKLLLTTSLLASIGFGSATTLAQTAAGAPAAGQPAAAAPAPGQAGQPGAAPQVTNPVLIQNQKMIQDIQRSVQEAQKKAEDEARRKAQMALQLVKPAMPQTPAQLADRAEAIKQNLAEAAPEVKAAREKEAQILAAKAAAARAAAQAQAAAAAAEANAVKLMAAADALKKPNPALGVNFTAQNVTPMLQGMDNMTKALAGIKTAADLPPPKLAAIAAELARLDDYMGKVDNAMAGMKLAGVETPANKEAMTVYSRAPEFGKNLEAEMARVERIVPQAKPLFDKFRQ